MLGRKKKPTYKTGHIYVKLPILPIHTHARAHTHTCALKGPASLFKVVVFGGVFVLFFLSYCLVSVFCYHVYKIIKHKHNLKEVEKIGSKLTSYLVVKDFSPESKNKTKTLTFTKVSCRFYKGQLSEKNK